ncbi:capsular polysaccharide synthesis protein [Celeribacter sp. ULVN23_4]
MTIYSMWYQGLEQAPDFVRRIHDIWLRMNPEEETHVVTGEEADDMISAEGIDPQKLSMQIRADIVRAVLLAERGGVWHDVSLIPSEPIDQWLPQCLDPEGFFAFRNPGADRIVSTWFLAAKAGHPLISAWRDSCVDYFRTPRLVSREAPYWVRFKNRRRIRRDPASFCRPEIADVTKYYPYFIMHYHFAWLVETRPDLAEAWARVPDIPAAGPLKLQSVIAKSEGQLAEDALSAFLTSAPVHKIRWKKNSEFYDAALAQLERDLDRRGA